MKWANSIVENSGIMLAIGMIVVAALTLFIVILATMNQFAAIVVFLVGVPVAWFVVGFAVDRKLDKEQ